MNSVMTLGLIEKSVDRVDTLIVLIGVILGLSIGKFVTCVGSLLLERKQVKFSFSYVMFMAALFTYQVYYWWTIWDLQNVESIGFVAYVRLLLIPLLLYCATAVLSPEIERGDGFNMWAHFEEHSRVLFLVITLLVVVGISQGYFFWEQRGLQIWIRFAALAVIMPGMIFKSRILNFVMSFILLILALVFVYTVTQDIQSMDELPFMGK